MSDPLDELRRQFQDFKIRQETLESEQEVSRKKYLEQSSEIRTLKEEVLLEKERVEITTAEIKDLKISNRQHIDTIKAQNDVIKKQNERIIKMNLETIQLRQQMITLNMKVAKYKKIVKEKDELIKELQQQSAENLASVRSSALKEINKLTAEVEALRARKVVNAKFTWKRPWGKRRGQKVKRVGPGKKGFWGKLKSKIWNKITNLKPKPASTAATTTWYGF